MDTAIIRSSEQRIATRSGGAVMVPAEQTPVHTPKADIVPNRKQIRDYRRSLRQRCDAGRKG